MTTRRLLACAIAFLGSGATTALVPDGVSAQQTADAASSAVPDAARALVVAIRAYRGSGTIAENGAGFILGIRDDSVFIATALHVIEDREDRTFVIFEGARTDSVRAVVAVRADSVAQIDLAILRVARNAVPDFDDVVRFLDRRGNAFELALGDQVSPVGCPDGRQGCWTAPSPPDQLLGNAGVLSFQSTFVRPGSSGGALFNQDWEVVGMVITNQQPRADAIPINQIVLQAIAWGIPVSLVPPSVPRLGYGLTVGGSLLFPSESSGERFPSARGSAAYRLNRRFGLLVSLLRLAPPDAGANCRQDATRDSCDAIANGVLGGIAVDVRRGRLSAHPFVEVGFAELSGRWDAGGIFVDDQYVPDWVEEKVTGLAWGAGLAMEATLFPHLILTAVGGSWAVPDPFASVSSPALSTRFPTLYYGAGLRIGF